MFHDTLSERDAQVVISMVNSRNDDLEATYIPKDNAAGDNGHTRKLCITRKKIDDAEEEESDQPVTSSVFSESASKEACDEKQQTPLDEEKGVVAASAEGTASAVAVAAKKLDFPKKKSKKVKIVKSLRFDKFSFPDMSIGPLGVGDVVTCNISQSRLSGAFIVENIMVLARKERSVALVSDEEEGKQNTAAISQRSFTGFVTEVVSNRQFGFITAVDEQGSKTGEHVFFHFKEVDYPVAVSGGDGDIAQDGSPPSSSAMSKNPGRSDAAIIRKGDEVKFDVRPGKNGKTTATNVSILPRGTLNTATNKTDNKSPTCTGYILMEPSHTSLANTPSHAVLQSGLVAGGGGGSRWDNVRDDKSTSQSGSNAKEGGVILLLSDPSHLFSPKPKLESHGNTSEFVVGPSKKNSGTDVSSPTEIKNTGNHPVKAADSKDDEGTTVEGMHLLYKTSSIVAVRGFSASANNRRNDGPKRGDLVRFGKTRGAKLVKDIRIEKMGAAASVTGVLTDINKDDDTAIFVSSDTIDGRYAIKLTEVVSCDKSLLKDNEQVDGILHQGKIFGVCRTKDIYLASSFGRKSGGSNSSGGLKERPKLNLTVKKELQGMGGQIMAQSRMAKGPDGTNGFAPEWTKRTSLYAATEEEEEYTRSLSAAASEFVPNFTMIAASGFESLENTTVE